MQRILSRLWRAPFDRWLPRLMGLFVLGCLLGTLAGLLWPAGLLRSARWAAWLEGQRVPYGRLLLQMLRTPVLLCLAACARSGRRLAPVVWGFCGAALSYVVAALVLTYGAVGLLMAVVGLLVHGLLPLPVLLYLTLCCCARRAPAPWDGALMGRLLALLVMAAAGAAVEYWITPVALSFLRWVSG